MALQFTLKEWGSIRHDMEVAAREYEKLMLDCKPSDNELSMYQIFKRQMEQTHALIQRIDNTPI